ncbi:hypothetical protein SAMN04487898_1091, partial [Pedobacter sp. ok626]
MILKNYLTSMKVLVIWLFLLFGAVTCAFAQEADTSMADLEFTEIGPDTTTKVDTATVAQATTVTDTTKTTTATSTDVKANKAEKEKTLWET